MPSLNLDVNFFDHPKTRRLVGLLGRGSEVLPIRLWCYCGKYHTKDGKLSGYSPQEIESLVGWRGNPGRCVDAMVKVSFLDKDDDGYRVHDWKEHAGHIEAFRIRAKKGAKAKLRAMKNSASSSASSRASPDDKHSLYSAGQDNAEQDKNSHTAPACEAALAAFDRWAGRDRGYVLSPENNEHRPVLDLIDDVNQGPPIVRGGGREVVPAGLMVPVAVETCIKAHKPFKSIKYAAKTVKELLGEWAKKGMPGENGNGVHKSKLELSQEAIDRVTEEEEVHS